MNNYRDVSDGPYEVNVKRFYFPGILETKCPKCGLATERDFMQGYVSYPSFNAVESVGFECYHEEQNDEGEWVDKGCGEMWEVNIRLRLQVELVED